MIPDFKTYIGESVWTDMQKRSSGETIRKEDDVNLLDAYGLYDYIKQNYSIKTQTTITRLVGNGGSIYISLYEDTDGYDTILMYDNIDGDRRLYISGGFKETGEYIYNEMCSEYTLTELNDEDPDGHPLGNIRIEPKGCRYKNLTNKFFLEVLDFIIERIDKPLDKQIEKI